MSIYAYPIIHSVHERFRGLPVKLASISDKTEDWYRSHGYEPKTVNPLKNGNLSEADHFMRQCRKYEAAEPGAGRLLSNKVHQELEHEFAEGDRGASQGELHVEVIDETCDVEKWLARFRIENATRNELLAFEAACDEAIDAIARAKARARVRLRTLDRTQVLTAVTEKFKTNGAVK